MRVESSSSYNQIDTKHRAAPEETWVSGGLFKTPCINILYVQRFIKAIYEKTSKNTLIFVKAQLVV